MKKLAALSSIVFAVVFFVFTPAPSSAYVYDHFDTGSLNSGLWTDNGPNTGLFSFAGSSISFSLASGSLDGITSKPTAPYGLLSANSPFSVSMQYSISSFSGKMILMAGSDNMSINLREYKSSGVQYFDALWKVGSQNTQALTAIQTTSSSGWLKLSYDGSSTFSFYYSSDGVNYGTPLGTFTPSTLPTSPYDFGIIANPGSSGTLGFSVDQVQVEGTSVTVPPSLLLLVPGFAGLIALRKRYGQ